MSREKEAEPNKPADACSFDDAGCPVCPGSLLIKGFVKHPWIAVVVTALIIGGYWYAKQ